MLQDVTFTASTVNQARALVAMEVLWFIVMITMLQQEMLYGIFVKMAPTVVLKTMVLEILMQLPTQDPML